MILRISNNFFKGRFIKKPESLMYTYKQQFKKKKVYRKTLVRVLDLFILQL
jgi:hypothetical protein